MNLKSIQSLVIALSIPFFIASCGARVASSPLNAGLYTDVKYPLMATGEVGSTKVGKAEASNILGIFATGDAGIEAAMRNGNITKISHIDIHANSVLGIFATYTIYVYGE